MATDRESVLRSWRDVPCASKRSNAIRVAIRIALAVRSAASYLALRKEAILIGCVCPCSDPLSLALSLALTFDLFFARPSFSQLPIG